jgi:pyrroloquinoline-quinone synthase
MPSASVACSSILFIRIGKRARSAVPRLQHYAEQYYLRVEAFPRNLMAVATRAGGNLRQLILENLAKEEDPRAPHAKLWRDFASAVGVESFDTTMPLPGIERLLDTYRQVCSEASLPEAVASLYAYKAQVPEISATKMEGLARCYGVTTDEGLAYFRVHEQADRVHRAAWRGWLENPEEESREQHRDADPERVLRTARRCLAALWQALDSVQETGA